MENAHKTRTGIHTCCVLRGYPFQLDWLRTISLVGPRAAQNVSCSTIWFPFFLYLSSTFSTLNHFPVFVCAFIWMKGRDYHYKYIARIHIYYSMPLQKLRKQRWIGLEKWMETCNSIEWIYDGIKMRTDTVLLNFPWNDIDSHIALHREGTIHNDTHFLCNLKLADRIIFNRDQSSVAPFVPSLTELYLWLWVIIVEVGLVKTQWKLVTSRICNERHTTSTKPLKSQ